MKFQVPSDSLISLFNRLQFNSIYFSKSMWKRENVIYTENKCTSYIQILHVHVYVTVYKQIIGSDVYWINVETKR